MPTRRGSRSSHVRPRPPSTGRPSPQRVRIPAPDAYRLKKARGISSRRRRIPFLARVLLAAALVVLGGAVFLTAGGGVGALTGALSRSLFGFVDRITATPEPSATSLVVSDAPIIALPTEPYTNQPTADLQVTIPAVEVGNTGARLRIYLTLEGQAPAPIAEVPMGTTIRMVVPVELTPGRNDFNATIVVGGVESEPSPIVTFILDTDPPVLVLATPKEGATVNADNVTLSGTTQPRMTLLARNQANGTSISGQTAADGTFALNLPLENGTNAILMTGRDPAGNVGELTVNLVRGSGTLTASLTSSAARISTASLPVSIQLSALVLDPDGAPLQGAALTFTLTVPGIPPISKDAVSGIDGRASFTTTLPSDVTVGSGLATVLVATAEFGTTSAQKTITIVE
ncbi:MAG: hypothetical protein HYX54_00340 [Chloroflexi bacterium]|nr:hypothetical protein [Chloroflexota bacterium]